MVSLLMWTLMEMLVGLHGEHIDQHPVYTNFFALVAIVVYYLALKDKRDNFYNGKMTYLQALLTGVGISVVVTILSPLGMWLTHTLITPEYFETAIQYSVDSNIYTREEAEDYFNLKNYMIQATLFAPILGIGTTAVLAIFLKKS